MRSTAETLERDQNASAEASPEATRHRRFLLSLLLVSIGALWLPQLSSSIWLDEAGTYWLIRGTFSEAISRGYHYAPSGTLYLAAMWLVKAVGGSSEWMLRLPSVVAAVLGVFVLFRVGAYLVDRETGLLAAIVFATDRTVAFAATDARPYALPLLAAIASVYFLLQWVGTAGRRYGIVYALVTSAVVYLHKLFGVMFVVHAVYLWREYRAGRGPDARSVRKVAALLAFLLLPLLIETVWFTTQSARSWAGTPSVYSLAEVSISPIIAFALLLGIGVCAAVRAGPEIAWGRGTDAAMPLLFAWALAPPILLFVVAVTTPAKVFVPRFALSAAAGLALLVACAVRAIQPERARRIIAVIFVFLAIGSGVSKGHSAEDWRAAAAAVRPYLAGRAVPVLVRVGAIEERDVTTLVDPAMHDYLLGPLLYYPLDAEEILLPWSLDSQAQRDYLERLVADHLIKAERFVVITRAFGDNGTLAAWLRGRVGALGFCVHPIGNFGQIDALRFDRSREACATPEDAR
jgi:mannosyltransferase